MSSAPNPAETFTATAIPILELGRGWMLDAGTGERAVELGLAPGFGFWVLGRAGALGVISPEGVAAAIGFMAPALVSQNWAQKGDRSPRDFALEYAAVAAAWGRRLTMCAR